MRSRIGLQIESEEAYLSTDVFYAPESTGPTIIIRTPYGRHHYYNQIKHWIKRGYSVLLQDVRGRYESTGEWKPYVHERQDSQITMQWLMEQHWFTSAIPVGSSYEAATAFGCATGAGHDKIIGLISKVPTIDIWSVKYSDQGVLKLREHILWTISNGLQNFQNETLLSLLNTDPDWWKTWPVSEIMHKGGLENKHRDFFARVIRGGDTMQSFKDTVIAESELKALTFPTLHIGGWHDSQLSQTIKHAKLTMPNSFCVIGNWGHDLGQINKDQTSSHIQINWLQALMTNQTPKGKSIYDIGAKAWKQDLEETTKCTLQIDQQSQNTLKYSPFKVAQTGINSKISFKLIPKSNKSTLCGYIVVELDLNKKTWVDWCMQIQIYKNGELVLQSSDYRIGDESKEKTVVLKSGFIHYTFNEGEIIKLHISNSDYPEYALNLGPCRNRYTNEPFPNVTEQVTVQNIHVSIKEGI